MRVEVWADVTCPWCYIGKRRLEAALARFPHAGDVEVVWRSFELDPSAPVALEIGNVERLARKYRVSRPEAEAMIERVTAVAAGEGLELRLDLARPGSTFDAHRLLHLAASRGVQPALEEALLATYQAAGLAVGDHEALVPVAVAAGLDEREVRAVLAGDAFGEAVREDEAEATRLGAGGVPFFVVDRRWALAGAQPADVLLAALERAWSDRQRAGASSRG